MFPEPFRTMVVIAICLGLRVSEILGLQWGDISWKKCEVHIRRAVVLGTVGQVKTPGSESRMPLDPDLATLLLEYRRMAPSVSPRTGCFKIRHGGNPGGRRTFNRNGSVPPASRRPARTESDGTTSGTRSRACFANWERMSKSNRS